MQEENEMKWEEERNRKRYVIIRFTLVLVLELTSGGSMAYACIVLVSCVRAWPAPELDGGAAMRYVADQIACSRLESKPLQNPCSCRKAARQPLTLVSPVGCGCGEGACLYLKAVAFLPIISQNPKKHFYSFISILKTGLITTLHNIEPSLCVQIHQISNLWGQ